MYEINYIKYRDFLKFYNVYLKGLTCEVRTEVKVCRVTIL